MQIKIFFVIAFCFSASLAEAGIKNSQDILGGLLTRAGVIGQRPLSQQELVSLCEQGYTEAFYLYGGAGDKQVSCSNGTLRYRSAGDFRAQQNMSLVLDNINAGLSSGARTFIHCNNGAHASGFVAAVALRAFCGISTEEAVRYWGRTLGGYPLQEPNRSTLMNRLRNYPIRNELELSESDKSRLGCP